MNKAEMESCRYCYKKQPKKQMYEAIIFIRHKHRLEKRRNLYCDKRCASFDQMAHEG